MISETAAITTITIEIAAVVSLRLKSCEVKFFDCVKGDCEVEFLIGGIDGEVAGVSFGKADWKAGGVVRTGGEGNGCVCR